MQTTRAMTGLLATAMAAGLLAAAGPAAAATTSPAGAAPATSVAPDPDAGLGTATMLDERPAPRITAPGPITTMETAPQCINLSVEYGSVGTNMWATVVNRCGSDQRINIIVSGAPDSGCFTLRNGYQRRWTFTGINPKVTRIDRC